MPHFFSSGSEELLRKVPLFVVGSVYQQKCCVWWSWGLWRWRRRAQLWWVDPILLFLTSKSTYNIYIDLLFQYTFFVDPYCKWFQRKNYIQSTLTPILSPWANLSQSSNLSVSLSVRVSGRSSVLQVFSRGSWRTVCSEAWDSHLGSVACRQLGYNRYKQLQCTIRQLYSSGISGHKKNLAPQRSRSRKKIIEYMYSNTDSEQIFIRPYGLKYRMH